MTGNSFDLHGGKFGRRKLLARVRVALLHSEKTGEAGATEIEFGSVRIDLLNRSVKRGRLAVHLTPIEYRRPPIQQYHTTKISSTAY